MAKGPLLSPEDAAHIRPFTGYFGISAQEDEIQA